VVHSKEHVSLHASRYTGARLHAGITLHVSFSALNHTPHNPKTVMTQARLYKGELATPSRYTSLSTTLLKHSSSVSLLTLALEC